MPISIDDFEAGHVPDVEQSVPLRVAIFLSHHDDEAFTRSEIAVGIDADPDTVTTALSQLKQSELVRHRGNYWAITEDRERLRGAYDLHVNTEPYHAAAEDEDEDTA